MPAKFYARFEVKLADAWIGVFWRWREPTWKEDALDIWICVLPCLPLHITLIWVDMIWLLGKHGKRVRLTLEELSDD